MNRLPICAMLICTLLVLTLCSCQPERPSAPSDREVAFEYQNHPDLLSDDLDTRFQQLFYYELDQPTVEEPFPPAPYSSPEQLYGGNGGLPDCLNGRFFIPTFFPRALSFLWSHPMVIWQLV